jgi:hypothetical protein
MNIVEAIDKAIAADVDAEGFWLGRDCVNCLAQADASFEIGTIALLCALIFWCRYHLQCCKTDDLNLLEDIVQLLEKRLTVEYVQ